MKVSAHRRTGLVRNLAITVALTLFALMAISVSPRMGVTADEVVHLTGGYTYWTENDYRLHPENGNLPQRIAGLGLLALDLEAPPQTHPGWLRSQANVYGASFFYDVGNPVDKMLLFARVGIVLVGVFLVWLTWRWASGLFGFKAGIAALVLAIFSPTYLAHAGLATSDITAAAMMLAALSAMWSLMHKVTWLRLALAGAACGGAFLAKMSGVLIIPVIAIMIAVRTCSPAPMVVALSKRRQLWICGRVARLGVTLCLTTTVALGSLVVLWSGYGFRYTGFNPASTPPSAGYYYSWEAMLGEDRLPHPDTPRATDYFLPPRPMKNPGLTDRIIKFARDHRLLPEPYLWGFAQADTFSKSRSSFLAGEHSTTGWPEFFPVAFLLKTTPASLLLVLIATCLWLKAVHHKTKGGLRRSWIYKGAPLWIFGALYWAVAVNTNLNIGHRHILPIYPIFYVLAAFGVAQLLSSGKPGTILAVLLLSLHAADSIAARPSYLSYFTPLVGGPSEGHRYLVDSSYDWGQGLPELRQWIDERREEGDKNTIYLSYFGADSPRARDLEVVQFGDEIYDRGPRAFPAKLGPGWYIISATQLRRVYGPGRGRWTQVHESLYRELHNKIITPGHYAERPRQELKNDTIDYELLQAARLFNVLSNSQPREVIGGSLLVYKLDHNDLNYALYQNSALIPPQH